MRLLVAIFLPLLVTFNEPLISGYQFGGEQKIKEKKVIIFNHKNYWDLLIKLLENMKKEEFMNDNFYSDLIEINDLNKLRTLLKSF